MMERFRNGQRVIISDPNHHLYERRGTVIQVRDVDGAARVRIERGLHPDQWLIWHGVTHEDETILFPGHCDLLR